MSVGLHRRLCVVAVAIGLGFAAAANAASIESMPAPMLGVWGWDAAACADTNGDGRVTVYTREVEFAAGTFGLTDIDLHDTMIIHAKAIHHEEGAEEATNQWIELGLTPSGTLAIQASTGLGHTYVKCRPL